jgi:riboflavin biosynthesis pyrimidine reductase
LASGTLLADDPLLTVRRVEGRSPAQGRDRSDRASAGDARFFADDGAGRLIVCGDAAAISQQVMPSAFRRQDGRCVPAPSSRRWERTAFGAS